MKGHFWYSERQAELYVHLREKGFEEVKKNIALINGHERFYTEMSYNNEPRNWDDALYLGEGEWLRSVGVW